MFSKHTTNQFIYEFTNKYFKTLKWSKDTKDITKTYVYSNIRAFIKFLLDNNLLNINNISLYLNNTKKDEIYVGDSDHEHDDRIL